MGDMCDVIENSLIFITPTFEKLIQQDGVEIAGFAHRDVGGRIGAAVVDD